jgi:hypothetical protein
MTGWPRSTLRYFAVTFVLLAATNACRRDPNFEFMKKMVLLTGVKDDTQAVEAIADMVGYAREHDIKYRCEMHLTGSGELVPPSELGRHLNDDIEVTIHVDTPDGFTEERWNPPSNGYLAQLVGSGSVPAP